MEKAGESAVKNFSYAFTGEGGPKNETNKPERGPVATTLADALAKSRADAAAINTAAPQTITSKEGPAIGTSSQALKATDSRSKEGIAEMFRLMRGTGDEIQEKQLDELKQINSNLSEPMDETLVDFAGA
jgi:hypothetical protein